MKLSRLLLLLVLAAVLAAGITFIIYTLAKPTLPAGTQSLPYQFSVAEYPGFDVSTDIFRLGAVSSGSSSSRVLMVTDPLLDAQLGMVDDVALKRVRIVAVGEGSEWLSIVPSETTVPAAINISVSVPADAEHKVYRGELLVIPVTNS